jgi:hypothetical protein
MPDSIEIQLSKLERTTLFIETLWISLLFYGFYIIARFLPDSPEFKIILNAIYEKNQQNQRTFENQVSKAAKILLKLVHVNFRNAESIFRNGSISIVDLFPLFDYSYK